MNFYLNYQLKSSTHHNAGFEEVRRPVILAKHTDSEAFEKFESKTTENDTNNHSDELNKNMLEVSSISLKEFSENTEEIVSALRNKTCETSDLTSLHPLQSYDPNESDLITKDDTIMTPVSIYITFIWVFTFLSVYPH